MPRFAPTALVVLSLLALVAVSADNSAVGQTSDPLPELTRTYDRAIAYFNGIKSYRALILLTERNDGKVKGTERVQCMYRKQPLRLYFKWLEGGPYAGLQASYDPQRDGPGHYLALETGMRGLVGVQRWSLDSRIIYALYPHHFTIEKYNLGFLVQDIYRIHNRGLALKKISATDKGFSIDLIPGLKLHVYDVTLSDDPADGLLYKRCVLGIDERTSMPRVVDCYDFEGRLWLSYHVLEFEPNAAIDDAIFELKKD